MGYLTSKSNACWRDGRGAIRCVRASGGLGDDLNLPGAQASVGDRSATLSSLIRNLNRFTGSGVPVGQKISDNAFATGKLTPDIALAVIVVAHRRAKSAAETFNDEASQQLLTAINGVLTSGTSDPDAANVAFVEGNMAQLAATLQGFADSLGLPPAKPESILGHLKMAGVGGVAIGAAVAGFLYLYARKAK